MVILFNKIIAYIFFCLALSLIIIDTRFSKAVTDSTETQNSTNTITVTQEGSGNSVSISQSGSKGKTTSTVRSSGEKNYTEITTDSDTLRTNVMFEGKSNLLVTHPGPLIQFYSIKTSPGAFMRQNFNFNNYYFILKRPEESLYIHQTSDGVRINNQKQ